MSRLAAIAKEHAAALRMAVVPRGGVAKVSHDLWTAALDAAEALRAVPSEPRAGYRGLVPMSWHRVAAFVQEHEPAFKVFPQHALAVHLSRRLRARQGREPRPRAKRSQKGRAAA